MVDLFRLCHTEALARAESISSSTARFVMPGRNRASRLFFEYRTHRLTEETVAVDSRIDLCLRKT